MERLTGYALQIGAAPTFFPITTEEAREHCRITHTDDDPYLDALIELATAYVESKTHRQLCTATWNMYLDEWPDVIELPKPPLTTYGSLKYYDPGGTLQTLTKITDYVIDEYGIVGRLYPAYAKSWPSIQAIPRAIVCNWLAGAAHTADIPAPLRHAVKMMVRYWYAMREPAVMGTTVTKIPMGIDNMLAPYVVPIF